MRADLESKLRRIASHKFVNAVRRDRTLSATGAIVADGSEQSAALVDAMSSRIEVIGDKPVRAGMESMTFCGVAGTSRWTGSMKRRLKQTPSGEMAPPQKVMLSATGGAGSSGTENAVQPSKNLRWLAGGARPMLPIQVGRSAPIRTCREPDIY